MKYQLIKRVPNTGKRTGTLGFRLDAELIEEFREVIVDVGMKKKDFITNAIKMLIEESKGFKDGDY